MDACRREHSRVFDLLPSGLHRVSMAREGGMRREMVRIVERRKPSQDKGFRAFLLVSESGFLGLITRRAAFDAKADPVGRSGSGSS